MTISSKRIQSLERAFMLLEQLSLAEQPLSLQTLSERVQLKKTTVYGLLATLVELGYVGRANQAYTLGLRLRELSKPLEQQDETIRQRFNPLLNKIARLCGQTAYLAVQSGSNEYLYIDAIESEHPLAIRSPRGKREGLTTSAIGKVFLACDDELKRRLRLRGQLPPALEIELEQVRQQGFALDLEEAEPGLNCLAIPLYLHGECVAVAGLSGAAQLLSPSLLGTLYQQILD